MKHTQLLALGAVLCVGVGGMSISQAETIKLGKLDTGTTRHFGDSIPQNTRFTDFVTFSLSTASEVTATFKSFYNLVGSSFKVELQELEGGSWVDLASGHGKTDSFALNLTQGPAYRWELVGKVGNQTSGFWNAKMNVATVPEADTWVMLLVGAGLVGYQLRRKQNALNQPPFGT
jgi:hypothetical protein